MAEFERTRTREREAPVQNDYERALKRSRDRAERNATGRIVCKQADCPQMLTRQGRLRYYLADSVEDTPLRDWIVFTHEIRTLSGKHRHQGGLIIYVIEGRGVARIDGVEQPLEKGSAVFVGMNRKHHFLNPHAEPMTFLALRMYINDEMGQLERGLAGALEALSPGGRLAAISFHSLEDRAVKRFMQRESQLEPALARLPVVPAAAQPRLKLVGRKTRPTEAELRRNPRARSALLRVAQRVA